jgi:hypothetical protein
MKTTGKILLGGLGAVLIGITVFLFVGKAKASDVVEIRHISPKDRTRIEKTYDFRDFQNIEMVGGWEVTLSRGDDYSITVAMPKYLEEMIAAKKNGNTLSLAVRPETQFNIGPNPVTVDITLPRLHGFQSRGGSKVRISDFDVDSLRIRSDGATSINADDNVISSLVLRTTGAADVDFRDSKVTNADVRIQGAGSLKITMEGGKLTGSVAGASSVVYYGSVSEENIRTEGLASITHR